MAEMSVAEVGRRLVRAGRLDSKPLCVYGTEVVESEWIPTGKIDFCLVKVFLKLAMGNFPPAFAGVDTLKGCCPGGATHLGLIKAPDGLKYFISTGDPSFRGGEAEYLRRSPQMIEETSKVIGKITPLSKNIVFRPCADLEDEDPGVVSVMCLGTAEQIRNIFALDYFSSTDVFGSIVVPAGSACATLVTYPSGMSANSPRNAMFAGPTDPTVNHYFPHDFMGVGIPIKVAKRMCEPIEESFVVKRPHVAYPEKRDALE